jgi:hypothetical protein
MTPHLPQDLQQFDDDILLDLGPEKAEDVTEMVSDGELEQTCWPIPEQPWRPHP